jgi:hypothetical protein
MKIDVEQSILRKRIIYKKTLLEKINYIIDFYFWVFSVPVLTIFLIYYDNSLNNKELIFYFIINLPFIWNMFGLKYIDKLSYLGEIKINQRNDFLKEIKLKYNYDKIVEDNDLIIMKKSWKWFKLGEELIILFDKEKVLANLTTLGKYDIKVTFFFYKDQIKLSKLKNYC